LFFNFQIKEKIMYGHLKKKLLFISLPFFFFISKKEKF